MKTQQFVLAALIGLSAAAAAVAVAAQDQSQIEATRKQGVEAKAAAAAAQDSENPAKPVLPLDHGPHAQVTPWYNEQRRLRAAAGAGKQPAQPDNPGQKSESR